MLHIITLWRDLQDAIKLDHVQNVWKRETKMNHKSCQPDKIN